MDNSITTETIGKMPFNEMLEKLRVLVLKEVPHGGLNDPAVLTECDRQLGYWANLYAWMIYLWAFMSSETNKAKLISTDKHAAANKKKEALYELSQAVKMKRDSVSRMITVKTEIDGEHKGARNFESGAGEDGDDSYYPFGRKAGRGATSPAPKAKVTQPTSKGSQWDNV